MKTSPWKKTTKRDAMFELPCRRCVGMMGYFATFHSMRKKMTVVRRPNNMRQRTVALDQG